MSKRFIIEAEVEDCYHCPNYDRGICSATGKDVLAEPSVSFPLWCPLKDWEKR